MGGLPSGVNDMDDLYWLYMYLEHNEWTMKPVCGEAQKWKEIDQLAQNSWRQLRRQTNSGESNAKTSDRLWWSLASWGSSQVAIDFWSKMISILSFLPLHFWIPVLWLDACRACFVILLIPATLLERIQKNDWTQPEALKQFRFCPPTRPIS